MLISSFKPAAEVMSYPPSLIPNKLTFENYTQAWATIPFTRYIMNSSIITSISMASVIITSLLAAYGLVIIKVKGRQIIFSLVLFGLILPMQTSFIPVFMMVHRLNLIDTYIGVILPYLTTAFGVFLLSQFIKSIPIDLVEAARIDGMSEIKIMLKIITPLTKPGILTLAIFTFMNVWKDFFWPFLLLNRDRRRTLPLGIVTFWQSESPHYSLILAAGIIALIPLIIMYSLFQRQFVQGVALSGLKE
jgi:ABC-type glycerol-3-phosphate transport system permease component